MPEENISPEKENNLKKIWSFAWEMIKIAIVAIVIVLPIRYFLFQPFIVNGESMVPNFQGNDYLIVDEISYRFSAPQRGDVIVFDYPEDVTQRFIKRVIGLPGETVTVSGGKVQITKDDKTETIEEKYLPDSLKTIGDVKITLQNNEYFVMGDNRDYSFDSRAWGPVNQKYIVGKAFLRLFPVNEIGVINRPNY